MSTILRKSGTKGNLVLRMSPGDSLLVGKDIEVKLEKIESFNRLKMVITAPVSTKIRRKFFEERNLIQTEDPETT